jgi:hypothetical protein
MKLISNKLTTTFALLLIMFSIAVPGAYAVSDGIVENEPPKMNSEEMKERNIEMIENNIEKLNELRTITYDEELIESIDNVLEEMELLKSEIESADDDEDIMEMMGQIRTLIEESPDVIREALIGNREMPGPAQDGNQEIDDNPSESRDYNFPGNNNTMKNNSVTSDNSKMERTVLEKNENENTGLLSGIISKIKAFFQ